MKIHISMCMVITVYTIMQAIDRSHSFIDEWHLSISNFQKYVQNWLIYMLPFRTCYIQRISNVEASNA